MRGKIFCLISIVPQNGAKYLATNLGYFIKKNKKTKKKKVLLIDFDFANPTLCHHFVDSSTYNIDNLSLMEEDLNFELFRRAVVKTKLGFDILKGTKVCNSEIFSRDVIAKILNLAKEIYDYIFVVANPQVSNSATIVTLLNANKVILVAKNDYTNDFKFKDVLASIGSFIKNKSDIKLVYNCVNFFHKTKIVEKVKEYNVSSITILDYVPKSIDNINLDKKLPMKKRTINDKKFKKLSKELITE